MQLQRSIIGGLIGSISLQEVEMARQALLGSPRPAGQCPPQSCARL